MSIFYGECNYGASEIWDIIRKSRVVLNIICTTFPCDHLIIISKIINNSRAKHKGNHSHEEVFTVHVTKYTCIFTKILPQISRLIQRLYQKFFRKQKMTKDRYKMVVFEAT